MSQRTYGTFPANTGAHGAGVGCWTLDSIAPERAAAG
jgi:hypothetical protein